eukprot:TRINITY_DN10214_c0_g2_i1.p1 TRINITY_DN10214_c0_g2~~TRINITY_DN10214_c0_g2_i1.p1  ORF type:complete len:151 (+),score=40.51 TRINITY_DN10214_c0_g2_i1:1459-1911(+)
MAKQIAVMKATIDDMLQEHEYNMEQERLQFEHAKDRFSRTFEARLLRTKHRATEDAIANQGSRQQANQIDQLWLKRELELHQAAQSELEGSCLELETCNLRLLAQLHGTAAVCVAAVLKTMYCKLAAAGGALHYLGGIQRSKRSSTRMGT